MLALLDDYRITFQTIFDLLSGALDAWLDPHYRSEQAPVSFKRSQAVALTFFAAFAVFLFLANESWSIVGQSFLTLFGPGTFIKRQIHGMRHRSDWPSHPIIVSFISPVRSTQV
jgi:hypothetical protein